MLRWVGSITSAYGSEEAIPDGSVDGSADRPTDGRADELPDGREDLGARTGLGQVRGRIVGRGVGRVRGPPAGERLADAEGILFASLTAVVVLCICIIDDLAEPDSGAVGNRAGGSAGGLGREARPGVSSGMFG